MSAKTPAQLLARTTLALGWLVLAMVAKSVFAVDPLPGAKCNKELERGIRCPGWTAAIPTACILRNQGSCSQSWDVDVKYNDFKCEPISPVSTTKACVMAIVDLDGTWLPEFVLCYVTHECEWNANSAFTNKCRIIPSTRTVYWWELHEEVECPNQSGIPQ